MYSSVIHHTGLQSRGGATRVAKLLLEHHAAEGIACRQTFEYAEEDGAVAVVPEDLPGLTGAGALLHLHSTGDWNRLLAAVQGVENVVITVHDTSLFSCACPRPDACELFASGCVGDCPRGLDVVEERKLRGELLRSLAPVLVTPSRWMAQLARIAVPELSVKVVPNGVPWPEALPSRRKAREAFGIHPAAKAVLFVAHGGTRSEYKGGDTWDWCWAELKRNVPGLVGFGVGGDTMEEKDGLHVWPYLDRERLSMLMAACDVLMYPTRCENHSMLIMESMAQGLVVSTFAVGGIPEQIQQGRTGLLAPERDMETLLRHTAMLLQRPTECRDISNNAFFAGQQRFASGRMAAGYLKIYRSLGLG